MSADEPSTRRGSATTPLHRPTWVPFAASPGTTQPGSAPSQPAPLLPTRGHAAGCGDSPRPPHPGTAGAAWLGTGTRSTIPAAMSRARAGTLQSGLQHEHHECSRTYGRSAPPERDGDSSSHPARAFLMGWHPGAVRALSTHPMGAARGWRQRAQGGACPHPCLTAPASCLLLGSLTPWSTPVSTPGAAGRTRGRGQAPAGGSGAAGCCPSLPPPQDVPLSASPAPIAIATGAALGYPPCRRPHPAQPSWPTGVAGAAGTAQQGWHGLARCSGRFGPWVLLALCRVPLRLSRTQGALGVS